MSSRIQGSLGNTETLGQKLKVFFEAEKLRKRNPLTSQILWNASKSFGPHIHSPTYYSRPIDLEKYYDLGIIRPQRPIC